MEQGKWAHAPIYATTESDKRLNPYVASYFYQLLQHLVAQLSLPQLS